MLSRREYIQLNYISNEERPFFFYNLYGYPEQLLQVFLKASHYRRTVLWVNLQVAHYVYSSEIQYIFVAKVWGYHKVTGKS